MKKQYLISLLGAASLLAACDKQYTGVTKITQTFVARQKPDSAAVVRVEAGDYSTKVKVAKDTTTLVLGSTTFAVRTPSRLNEGGIFQNFDLSPNEIGQTFGLKGRVATQTYDSAPFSQSSSCVYDSYRREVCRPGYWERGGTYCERDERYCRRVPDRSRDGYRCEWEIRPGRCYREADRWVPGECHTETEYVYGRRITTGFNRTVETALNVRIQASNGNSLGNLKIQDKSQTSYIQTNVGPCLR